jgi:hypothetical protein
MATQPTACKTSFPVELLGQIFLNLSPHDLSPVALVNSTFYAVVIPLLYRDIVLHWHYADTFTDLRCWSVKMQWIASQKSCLTTLCEADHLACLVRTIDIDWSELYPSTLATFGLFRLINPTLRRLNGLTSASIRLPSSCKPSISCLVYKGCQFTLSQFTTSKEPSSSLGHFLQSQPGITYLRLLGASFDTSFTLDGSALPQLTRLETSCCYSTYLAEVIRGRPLRHVTFVSNSSTDLLAALDAVSLASLTIQDVVIHARYHSTLRLNKVLQAVVECIPNIHTLQVRTDFSCDEFWVLNSLLP